MIYFRMLFWGLESSKLLGKCWNIDLLKVLPIYSALTSTKQQLPSYLCGISTREMERNYISGEHSRPAPHLPLNVCLKWLH